MQPDLSVFTSNAEADLWLNLQFEQSIKTSEYIWLHSQFTALQSFILSVQQPQRLKATAAAHSHFHHQLISRLLSQLSNSLRCLPREHNETLSTNCQDWITALQICLVWQTKVSEEFTCSPCACLVLSCRSSDLHPQCRDMHTRFTGNYKAHVGVNVIGWYSGPTCWNKEYGWWMDLSTTRHQTNLKARKIISVCHLRV